MRRLQGILIILRLNRPIPRLLKRRSPQPTKTRDFHVNIPILTERNIFLTSIS